MPHTFTNNYLDYISITPVTFGAGMTYELSASIKNLSDYNGFLIYFGDSGEASTNIPGDYDNSHYIQVRNGNLLFRLAPKADNSEGQHNLSVNISNWDLFMKPYGTHIVVSISSDGYTMIVYVNGVLCDGTDGNTTVNTSTIQASGGKYEQRIPKQIILGGDGKAEIPSTEINFGDIKNLSVEQAQTSLTSNFSNISPQFLVSGATATSSNSQYNDSVSTNGLAFSYDATGTTFSNTTTSHTQSVLRTESNAIDLSSTYNISGLTGSAPRTIIATFNINATAVNLHHVIVGYGTVSPNKQFVLRVSSLRGGTSAASGVYALGFWGNSHGDHWLDSNIGTISAGVETTAAVSWDGTNIYLFLKNSSTGQWVMDSSPESLSTGTDYGLMIGAWPSSTTEVIQPFNGTIGEVAIYDFAVTSINSLSDLIYTPNIGGLTFCSPISSSTETIQATFGNNYWGAPTRNGPIHLYKNKTYIFDWSNVNHSYAQGPFKIYTTNGELTENVIIDTNAETTTLTVTETTPTQLKYGGDAWGVSPNGTITFVDHQVNTEFKFVSDINGSCNIRYGCVETEHPSFSWISMLPTVKLHKEGQAVGAPAWAGNAAWDAQRIYGTFTNDQQRMDAILATPGVSHKYFIWNESQSQLYSLQSEADPDSGTYTINGFNTYKISGASMNGYTLTNSYDNNNKTHILYQGVRSDNEYMSWGNFWNSGGFYTGSTRLSTNPDSDGNSIPLGEWHTIEMPISIFLNKINMVARGETTPTKAPRKWKIYGANTTSEWSLLYSQNAASESIVGGSAGTSNVVSWLGDGSAAAKENIHNGSMIGYGSSLPYWGRDVTSGNSWVGFELNQTETIISYRIWPLAGLREGEYREAHAPRDWTIQGSNDNSNWTIIDTRVGQTFSVGLSDSEAQSSFGHDVLLDAETDAIQYSNLYNIASPGSYKYYKINVTDTSNRTYDSYTMITEIAYYI